MYSLLLIYLDVLKHICNCCKETAVRAIKNEYKINVCDIEELSDEIVEKHFVSLKNYFTADAWDILTEKGTYICMLHVKIKLALLPIYTFSSFTAKYPMFCKGGSLASYVHT